MFKVKIYLGLEYMFLSPSVMWDWDLSLFFHLHFWDWMYLTCRAKFFKKPDCTKLSQKRKRESQNPSNFVGRKHYQSLQKMYLYIILPAFTLFLIICLVSNHSCSRDCRTPIRSKNKYHTHNITWYPPGSPTPIVSSWWLRSDEELRLIDVTPLSLGLQTAGGFMTTVLFPLLQGLGVQVSIGVRMGDEKFGASGCSC